MEYPINVVIDWHEKAVLWWVRQMARDSSEEMQSKPSLSLQIFQWFFFFIISSQFTSNYNMSYSESCFDG